MEHFSDTSHWSGKIISRVTKMIRANEPERVSKDRRTFKLFSSQCKVSQNPPFNTTGNARKQKAFKILEKV